jgi:large subunit ribosomal protein L23Ae
LLLACLLLCTPTAKDAKGKAAAAAKAVKKNTWKKSLKPKYSAVFHRPKTLKRTRAPKYSRTR